MQIVIMTAANANRAAWQQLMKLPAPAITDLGMIEAGPLISIFQSANIFRLQFRCSPD